MADQMDKENEWEKSTQPLLELRIQLTEQEIAACLKSSARRAGKGRLWFQTGLLIFIFIYSFVPFVAEKEATSLLISMASLVILAAMWIVPVWQARHDARELAKENSSVYIKLYEDGITFGEDGRTTLTWEDCKSRICGNLIVLTVRNEVIGIPRRLTDEDGWKLLLDKLRARP